MATGWPGVSQSRSLGIAERQKYPWSARCPEPHCFFCVSAKTEQEAQKLLDDHRCPYTGGVTKIGWSVTKTLLEQVWDMADECYVKLKDLEKDWIDDQISPRRSGAVKGELNGYCKMLAIFMVPHFSTPKEVGLELERRFENKEDPDYETAGLGTLRFQPPPPPQKPVKVTTNTRRRYTESEQPDDTPKVKPPLKIKHADFERIRKLKGQAPADQVALMFKRTAEEIEQIWNF